MKQALLLAALAAIHLALTALPGVASVLSAARLGLRDAPALLSVGLVGSGVAGFTAFWAYFAAPAIGHAYAFGLVAVSMLVCLRYRRALSTQLRQRLLLPAALWCLGSLFLIFMGFLFGGTDQPIRTATTRFSHQLPSDNYLPLFFADALFAHGHDGPPAHFADWLSSDRPPLQSGFVLSQRIFTLADPALHYQVLAVALQQLWIVGLWCLLLAMQVGTTTRALVVIALLLSDVAIVNGFFVWPKQLSGAYLLAAAAFVLRERWRADRADIRVGALVAALMALALLAHGGSIFGIIPLVVIAAARGAPTIRWIATALTVGLLLLAPWSLYQRYEDPPGDRLLKWMIAGHHAVDDRTPLEAIRQAYAAAGVRGAVRNKMRNFQTMLGGEQAFQQVAAAARSVADGNLGVAARPIRIARFFGFVPSLSLFVVAPILMWILRTQGRRNQQDWRFARQCLTAAGLGCLAWGLIMFGDPNTLTWQHAGSLALPILALAGCVAGLCAIAPRLAGWAVGLHGLSILALYLPSLDPVPESGLIPACAAAMLAALAIFILTASRWSGEPETITESLSARIG